MTIKKISEKRIFLIFFLIILSLFSIRTVITKEGVGSDGVFHFVITRSIFFDNDINVSNEYEFYNDFTTYFTGNPKIPSFFLDNPGTKTGHRNIVAPLGVDLLWLPFFALAHSIILFINWIGFNIPANGYSLPYEYAAGFGSILIGIFGLYCLYKFSRKYFDKEICLFSITSIFFASSLFFYTALQPSVSHVVSMAFVSFFIYWWFSKDKNKVSTWIILGIISGIMVMVRWQNILFLSVVGIEFIKEIFDRIKNKNFIAGYHVLLGHLLFFLFFTIFFSPQMFFWKIQQGSFLTIPQGPGFLTWFHPHLFEMLFLDNNGLFYFTPLILFSVIGLYFLYKKDKNLTLYFIIFLILQIYINSIVSDWNGGEGFGARRFINCTIIFVLGFAALVEYLSHKIKIKWIYISVLLLILWNLNLISQYLFGMIGLGKPTPLRDLIINTFKLIYKIISLDFIK